MLLQKSLESLILNYYKVFAVLPGVIFSDLNFAGVLFYLQFEGVPL